jgi:hypothetical protein
MKSEKYFDARINQDLTRLVEQAHAARIKYIRQILKSAYDAVVRGIRFATIPGDGVTGRQGERVTPESG